jgi:exodeoxyribonuclease V alpha subunit
MPVSCSSSQPGDFYHLQAETPAEVWSKIRGLLGGKIQTTFHLDPRRDVQVLTPMQRGELGARQLNLELQKVLNPSGDAVERFGVTYRVGDRVMQIQNNYDKEVFNGDMGILAALDREEQMIWVDFGGNKVSYAFNELDELILSYAVTIHKSQGSEYPCVILPLHTQHYVMLQRNLLYTGITRGRKLVLLIGPTTAVRMAVQQSDSGARITQLAERLRSSAD